MTGDGIWIVSQRDPHGLGSACRIQWDALEWYAPVADVRDTAEDLFTSAAYAEMLGGMIRMGLPTKVTVPLVSHMLSTAVADRGLPAHGRLRLGRPTTLDVLPAGSTKRRVGVVILQRGSQEAELTPAEARVMGAGWIEAAGMSETDTLIDAVLRRTGMLGATELDAVFGYVRDVREGTATLPPVRTVGKP